MMGDRDYRQFIKKAIDSIGKEVEPKIDPKDNKSIFLHEVVRCLRRSYYDRTDPIEPERTRFGNLVSGLLQNREHGVKLGEFVIEEIKLKGYADMIIDDVILIFRSSIELPETPVAADILYLNACMWIFNKTEAIVVYIASDGKEVSFSLSKNKKMFEETIRRIRVLNNLLEEKKTPILEPSEECTECQYHERCYIKRKQGQVLTLSKMLGLDSNKKNE